MSKSRAKRKRRPRPPGTAPTGGKPAQGRAAASTNGRAARGAGGAKATGAKAREGAGGAKATGAKAREGAGGAKATGAKAREGAGRAKAAGAKAREGAGGAKAAGAKTTGAKAREGAGRAKATGAKAREGAGGATARGGAGGSARRPDPIWAPFPLTEVGMGVGIVIFGVGYATTNTWLLSVGALVLAVVVGELCLREHFAGFRSHALLVAALAVVAVHSAVFTFTDAYRGPVALAVDLAIGGGLAWWLRGRFRIARERNPLT